MVGIPPVLRAAESTPAENPAPQGEGVFARGLGLAKGIYGQAIGMVTSASSYPNIEFITKIAANITAYEGFKEWIVNPAARTVTSLLDQLEEGRRLSPKEKALYQEYIDRAKRTHAILTLAQQRGVFGLNTLSLYCEEKISFWSLTPSMQKIVQQVDAKNREKA